MNFRSLIALAITLSLAVPVAAQYTNVPTVTGETGLFTLLSGDSQEKGYWSFGAYYSNWDRAFGPVSCLHEPFSDDWDYDHNQLAASIGYGLTDRLSLSLSLPYESYDANEGNRFGFFNGTEYFEDLDASGLGNARLGAKLRLVGEAGGRNTLALHSFLELPTGDDDEGVVTGDTGVGLGLAWNLGNFVANVGYRDSGDTDTVDLPTAITAGIGYAHPFTERLSWITELVHTSISGGDFRPNDPDSLDLTTGIRAFLGEDKQWSVNAALRNNLTGWDESTDELAGLVGVTYRWKGGAVKAREKAEADAAARAAEEAARAEEARRKAEEEARRKAEEEARRQAEEEARRKAEEEARRKAEEEARQAPKPQPVEETTHFDYNSSRVTNIGKAILDEIALKMKQDPAVRAQVTGYSDGRGSSAGNQTMSERRAEAVKAYLVSRHGIDASRIDTEGKGSADPVASNDTSEGRNQNRRAVIRLEPAS
ncbi:MAG: OmpA family protein [Deltaproteobacteria bacterium]|nr:OmpA family protein [Deltaproteobacteria bacterium]